MKFLALLLFLVITACGNYIDHVRLTSHNYVPIPDTQKIEVIDGAPTKPYERIAKLEAKQGGMFTTYEDLRQDLLEEARALGADAVMDLQMGGYMAGGAYRGTGGVGEYKLLTAVAIKFRLAVKSLASQQLSSTYGEGVAVRKLPPPKWLEGLHSNLIYVWTIFRDKGYYIETKNELDQLAQLANVAFAEDLNTRKTQITSIDEIYGPIVDDIIEQQKLVDRKF